MKTRLAFEVYTDASGEYRWRLVHPNGRIMADSGEGYKSKKSCLKAIETIQAEAPKATLKG